jgi:hypothetical protein
MPTKPLAASAFSTASDNPTPVTARMTSCVVLGLLAALRGGQGTVGEGIETLWLAT